MANIDSAESTPTTTIKKPTEHIQENNTPIETPVKKDPKSIDIEVTSKIIKHVGKKYRYFFDIRNNDDKAFSGTVVIKLYNDDGLILGLESFNTNQSIQPNLGSSVYIDANTGPTSIHGISGITIFKYEVKIDNVVTKSDEGLITDKYEDISL